MCIKVIFSIRRIGNMYLRYFLSWLFSGGRASFFIFFWLHTLLYHIPFAKKHPSCFCPQGAFLPAFLPASASHCSRNRRLTDALRKAGCRTSGHDPPRRTFWPAIGSFLPLQCQAGVAGQPTSCRHYGENMPACALRTRPSEARRFVFYFFTTAFGRSHNHFPPQR